MKPFVRSALAGLAIFSGVALSAAPRLNLELSSDRPLLSAGRSESLVLRLGIKAIPEKTRRAPLNLALVLDRSGSMQGAKISRLREAARHAIMRLRPDDVLSLIAFDSEVRVLRHAAKLRDGQDALEAIDRLEADGSTALYGGCEAALRELSEFKGKGRVSRMILISDGMANVGPSSPAELASLGREAGRRGVPITTFGLGYDFAEDLMTRLALASDGNHAFIPDEGGLTAYFDREMGEALNVAARDLVIEITLSPGVRFKRSLDREVEADGRVIRWKLNQISGGSEKRLLLELEAPALKDGDLASIASARVAYSDEKGGLQPSLVSELTVKGAPEKQADEALNAPVAADAALARANQKRDEAIKLKDAGKSREAERLIQENVSELKAEEKRTGVSSLGASAKNYESEAGAMSAPAPAWNADRKLMKARSYKESTQQAY